MLTCPLHIIIRELNEFLGSFNALLTFNPEAYPSLLMMHVCSVMLSLAFPKHPCLLLRRQMYVQKRWTMRMHEFQSMDPELGPTHSVGCLGDIWELEDPVYQGPKKNVRRTCLAPTLGHRSPTDKANSLDSIVKESERVLKQDHGPRVLPLRGRVFTRKYLVNSSLSEGWRGKK